MTNDELKECLASVPMDMVLGREQFAVGSWMHAAAGYIDLLEKLLIERNALLRRSCYPMQMKPKETK